MKEIIRISKCVIWAFMFLTSNVVIADQKGLIGIGGPGGSYSGVHSGDGSGGGLVPIGPGVGGGHFGKSGQDSGSVFNNKWGGQDTGGKISGQSSGGGLYQKIILVTTVPLVTFVGIL